MFDKILILEKHKKMLNIFHSCLKKGTIMKTILNN